MKYYSRLKMYKASNVTFDPIKEEARSYDWWIFVKRINGHLVFNNYWYSYSTLKHQRKVRKIVGYSTVDIEAPRGLQDLDSAVAYYKDEIATLVKLINKPRTNRLKNFERMQELDQLREKVKFIQENLMENKNG